VRLEFTIDVLRPVPDVFGVVGNLEYDPKWQQAVTQATKLSDGPIAEGTRFRHLVLLMGRQAAIDIEFRHYRSGQRYVLDCVTGPFEFTTDVRFEPIAGGTRVVTMVAGQPKGILKLAAVTLSNHRRREIDADLQNLKRLMEAGVL
jgi:uncharacterized membrane protein